MIMFADVTKSYDEVAVLKNITITIGKGELTYITGPSGAGKSTLLKLMYCAERPDSGNISVDEWIVSKLKRRTIPYFRRNVGVVFQDFKLLNSKTVYENVALALRIHHMNSKAVRERVNKVLRDIKLSHKADIYPQYLSGGEQQRVVIARAMVSKPMLLLADEPTGNLDADNARSIMKLFHDINTQGTTVIIATHNEYMYQGSGRRVLCLENKYIEREFLG